MKVVDDISVKSMESSSSQMNSAFYLSKSSFRTLQKRIGRWKTVTCLCSGGTSRRLDGPLQQLRLCAGTIPVQGSLCL